MPIFILKVTMPTNPIMLNFSNGLPGVYFNKLESDSLQGLVNSSRAIAGIYCFFVYNSTGNPIGGSIISIADNSTPTLNVMFIQSGGSDIYQVDSILTPDFKFTTNSTRIMSNIINLSGAGQIYENGVLRVTGNIAANSLYPNPLLYIGKRADNFYFNGTIGELIIFNQTLKDEDRKLVEKYLGKK